MRTCFSQSRNHSANSRAGFAIGTILLAVVLIAAIVSAIALASRDSVGSGEREKSRLLQALTTQQIVDMNVKAASLLSTGNGPTVNTADLIGAGYLDSPRFRDMRIIANPGTLYSSGFSNNVASGDILYFNLGSSYRQSYLVLYGLRDDSCNQINSGTYDQARSEILKTATFMAVPNLMGQFGLIRSTDGDIFPDDGQYRYSYFGEVRGPSLTGGNMATRPPTEIPLMPDKPICFKHNDGNGGTFNMMIQWSLN
jgi:hypothetical protein